jgi:uncharacterized protein (DUF1697 family)
VSAATNRALMPKPRKHAESTWIALLRGVNVGGHKRVPMAELRALAGELGWSSAVTYVQSGNLVFRAGDKAASLAALLVDALEAHFGFAVPVAVCSREDWHEHAAGGVFPDAEAARPKVLHLGLAAGGSSRITPKVVAALAPYCQRGERVAARDGVLWIDFLDGVASTKLTPAVLDRIVGAPVTLRNWNTVRALAGLADEVADTA